MKNLTRKLFLSICTLAICAVTLVSTTFAWYTTNTETKANSIVGTTAAAGDASIYISTDNKTWMQEVTISNTATSMKPLMLNGSDLVDIKHTAEKPSKGTAGTHYIEFTLYFKTAATTDDVKIALSSITVSNKAQSLTPFDNLLNGQKTNSIKSSDATYTKDVTNALAMTIDSASATTALLNTTAYSLDGFNNGGLKEDGEASDAHAYYEQVSGDTLTTEQKTPYIAYVTTTELAKLPSTGNSVSVTFRIFLSGNDADCFDACKGQSFNIDLEFNVIEEE